MKTMTIKEFLEKYNANYNTLHNRSDDRWMSIVEMGDYWLQSDTAVGEFLHECARERGDYFTSDREVAAVFYTLAEMPVDCVFEIN